MEKKSKLVVLGLIENQNNEYLLSQRYDPDVPEAHLKWDFPGGTNEFGESLEETLEREVLEETGLKIEIIECFQKVFLASGIIKILSNILLLFVIIVRYWMALFT